MMETTTATQQPSTLPRIAEYGDVLRNEWPRATVTVLAEAPGVVLHGRPSVRLVSVTAGYERAGSVMRWTDRFVAVWWEALGARQGQRYRLEDNAKAWQHFARLTVQS